MTPELELLLKQESELGYTTPLVTIESPMYSSEPELYNGNWLVDAAETESEFLSFFKEATDYIRRRAFILY